MFFIKQKILKTGLLEGMTDVHSHLLPGVDDGMKSELDSLAALEYMYEAGVRRIFLTPHIMSDMIKNTPDYLRQRFRDFLTRCPRGIELRLAGEYMLDADFEANIDRGLLTLGERHLLVETSYLSPPPNMSELLYKITLAGSAPVIAHPERYLYMNEQNYRELKGKGYKFQLNLFSLIGAYGHTVQQKAGFLMKEGLYDFTGSDIHHLKSYQNAMAALSLSRSMVKELERLLDNNGKLWN